jgi:hypothetical protein
MTNRNVIPAASILAAAVLGLAAAGAPGTTGAPAGRTQNSVVSFHDGARFYEVRLEDGEMTITENGAPIPEDRVRRERNHVILESESGDLMAILEIRPDGTLFYTGTRHGLVLQPEPTESLHIGVTIGRLGEALAAQVGIEENEGILIRSVERDAPAERAGLKRHDVLTEIDGRKVKGTRDLRAALEKLEEGDELPLKVRRGGREVKLDVRPELRKNRPPLVGVTPEIPLAPEIPLFETPETHWSMPRPDYVHLSEEDGIAFLSPATPVAPVEPVFWDKDRQRLERLEERLARLEELLEKLVEKTP